MKMNRHTVIALLIGTAVVASVVAKATPDWSAYPVIQQQQPPFLQQQHIQIAYFSNNRPYVRLNGDIVDGDYERFEQLTRNLPAGTVIHLASEGGIAVEGLAIGGLIDRKKFETYVTGLCASACAAIWVAGVRLHATERAQIGFHCAYNPKTLNCGGSSNAVIGAYLSRLGYSYKAIAYMTAATPAEDMKWLSAQKARELGININIVRLSDGR